MKFAIPAVLSILAATGLASPAADLEERESSKPFTSLAFRSASPIHFQPLIARGLSIYLGGKTASYCPPEVDPYCPPGNTTAFLVTNKSGLASMDANVPGGQQLYVARDGALQYTQAHSAYRPPGSYTGVFHRTPPPGKNRPGSWTFTGGGATGFVACPVKGKPHSYRVYANVKGFKSRKGCLGFNAGTAPYDDGFAAWQYT